MIQHVRSRLVLLASALAVAIGIVCAIAGRNHAIAVTSAGDIALVVLAAFALAVFSGLAGLSMARRSLRGLADATHNVVRDTTRRVPASAAPPGDELRELGEWVNFLAEDATRSHEALARERTLLSAVAEGLTQGVIAVDADHRIELLNDAARKMLGVTSTPVGEPLIEFVRVPQVFELVESSEAAQVEVSLPTGARTLIRVAHKWGAEGRVLLLEDVTAMRRLETVRRDFVANVSHELRTPVAVIRANAETLLAGAKDDPVMAPKLIEGLHRNAERLARLLADLLDLSRLEAGQYRLEPSCVELPSLIEQSMTAIGPQAAAREVTIEVSVPADLAVKADPKALDQIFVNLIDNGVKYTKPGGRVWVEAKPLGDHVRVEVRDNGPGIAAKHRERVFERFYRADAGRARETGGTGLGLSIVKHLVESMGGEVGFDANEPQGSIFWLRLPRSMPS